MKNKITINIDKKITEQILMENCLNEIASGIKFDFVMFKIGIYALEKRWHYDKIVYYIKLLKEVKK